MIEVILPVKDRLEITTCVQSLLQLPQIDRILVCDGGSQAECGRVLAALQPLPKVQILPLPTPGFNKSYLLNQGIQQSTAEFILVTDADIVWNEIALQQLQQSVNTTEDVIASVFQVHESQPEMIIRRGDRYTFTIIQDTDITILKIQPTITQQHRPGCGLLLSRRNTLLKLGGYKEFFQGWGWEDQDLLIRAQLLGIKVETTGRVLHLSHSDKQRNRFHQNAPPGTTRNRNLLVAIASLLQRNFWGNLSSFPNPSSAPKTIQIHLPQELRQWLYECCGEGNPDHDLSWARSAFENTDCLVATSTL